MVMMLVRFLSTVTMATPMFFSAMKDVQIMPTNTRLTGNQTLMIFMLNGSI